MTVQYKIVNLERTLPEGTVVTAHWTALLSDGEYNASAYGTVGFTRDESTPDFIQFEDLTEETVIRWIKEVIDTNSLEASLAAQILEQKAPKQASGLPWTSSIAQ